MPTNYSGPAYNHHDCRLPDVIRARAPRGLREKIRQAAEVEHVTAGELIRRAIEHYLANHHVTGDNSKRHDEPRSREDRRARA